MHKLTENLELLKKMYESLKTQKNIYKAGPYWEKKAKLSYYNIKKFGISDFRGASSIIGESFTDSLYLDIRVSLSNSSNFFKKCLGIILYNTPILSKLFDKQLNITKNLLKEKNELNKLSLLSNPRTHELINTYKIPISTIGGCLETVEINNVSYSLHYLNLLDQHHYLTDHIDFRSIRSVFEIGGGFGVNCHLLIENYPNIKKIIYLDIPPNLYIGTQYLKSFYGKNVVDFTQTMNNSKISFKNNDELEIICITPWQIENFDDQIDLLYNSHSFVEMPVEIVENYINKLKTNKKQTTTRIALLSYSCFDLNTTFDPHILPKLFKNNTAWIEFTKPALLALRESNLYFISDF